MTQSTSPTPKRASKKTVASTPASTQVDSSEDQQSAPAPIPPMLPTVQLERSYPLRLVIQTMRNGAVSNTPGGRPFLPHAGLMHKIRQAYDQQDSELFLSLVQSYLEQAVRTLPQAGLVQEIPGKIVALRTLINEIGLYLVGQRMLAVIYAPV